MNCYDPHHDAGGDFLCHQNHHGDHHEGSNDYLPATIDWCCDEVVDVATDSQTADCSCTDLEEDRPASYPEEVHLHTVLVALNSHMASDLCLSYPDCRNAEEPG